MAKTFLIRRLFPKQRAVLDPVGAHACCKVALSAAPPGSMVSMVLGPRNRLLAAWAFFPRGPVQRTEAALARLLLRPAWLCPQALALLVARWTPKRLRPGPSDRQLVSCLLSAALRRGLPLLDYLLLDPAHFLSLAALGWVPGPDIERGIL